MMWSWYDFNALIEVVKYSNLFLLANDIKRFKIIHTKQGSSSLQYGIDAIFQCFTLHVGSKCTSAIDQATYKMDTIP